MLYFPAKGQEWSCFTAEEVTLNLKCKVYSQVARLSTACIPLLPQEAGGCGVEEIISLRRRSPRYTLILATAITDAKNKTNRQGESWLCLCWSVLLWRACFGSVSTSYVEILKENTKTWRIKCNQSHDFKLSKLEKESALWSQQYEVYFGRCIKQSVGWKCNLGKRRRTWNHIHSF